MRGQLFLSIPEALIFDGCSVGEVRQPKQKIGSQAERAAQLGGLDKSWRHSVLVFQ